MALTMDDGIITVDDNDPVAIAARVRHLEEQIAGMPAEAVEAMGVDVGAVQSWLIGGVGQGHRPARRLQQQGQRSRRRRRPRPRPVWVTAKRRRRPSGARRCRRCPRPWARSKTETIGVGHADVLARQADRLSGSKKKAFEDAVRAAGGRRHRRGPVGAGVREALPRRGRPADG